MALSDTCSQLYSTCSRVLQYGRTFRVPIAIEVACIHCANNCPVASPSQYVAHLTCAPRCRVYRLCGRLPSPALPCFLHLVDTVLCELMCTAIYIHTYTPHIRTHTHTYTHMHTTTRSHAHTHTRTPLYKHTNTHRSMLPGSPRKRHKAIIDPIFPVHGLRGAAAISSPAAASRLVIQLQVSALGTY